jgi:hypothetical protein
LGPDIGDDDFRKLFDIEANSREAAEWLLSPAVRDGLRGERWLGLASRGIDVISSRQGSFDLDKLDPMLALLGEVELPG